MLHTLHGNKLRNRSAAWLAPCLLYFASGRVTIAHRQHP